MNLKTTVSQNWQKNLAAVYPQYEIEIYMPLLEEIVTLKKEKDAVLLGHNYMRPEVFLISDFHGDSLALARQAQKVKNRIILFNGVHFMAETAAILNPNRKVLIADANAGCSLAESITGEQVRSLKKQHPGVPVVTYINCSAEVKAESDVCCTSANALQIVDSQEGDTVLFLPDRYLAENIQKETKKKILSWEAGTCMVHELYTPQDLESIRIQYPEALIITHPECPKEVTASADFSGSTSQMSHYIHDSNHQDFFLVTECGMSDNLQMEFPHKNFIKTCHTCPHMKKITLEKIRNTLQDEAPEIRVPEKLRLPAYEAIQKMFLYTA